MPLRLRLYTRAGCHLCDQMLEELQALQGAPDAPFTVEIVDIDRNPALHLQYFLRIPVLMLMATGEILCEGRLDRHSLLRQIAAHRA